MKVKVHKGDCVRFHPSKGALMGFLLSVAKGCTVDAIPRRHRWESRHVPIETDRRAAWQIEATGLAPKDDRESAILMTLAPDSYTAIAR